MQSVYSQLVRECVFSPSDILDPRSVDYVKHPCLDSMGVVFSASELIRHRVPTEEMGQEYEEDAYMELSLKLRIALAASLFLSYKLASEDSWTSCSGSVSRHVFAKFVPLSDLTKREAFFVEKAMIQSELDLLVSIPVHSIVEFNVVKLAEYMIHDMWKDGHLASSSVVRCLCVVSFYANFLFRIGGCGCDHLSEILEANAFAFGVNCVAEALVLISICTLNSTFTVHINDIPPIRRLGVSSNARKVAETMLVLRLDAPSNLASLPQGFPSICSANVAEKAFSALQNSSRQPLMSPLFHSSSKPPLSSPAPPAPPASPMACAASDPSDPSDPADGLDGLDGLDDRMSSSLVQVS